MQKLHTNIPFLTNKIYICPMQKITSMKKHVLLALLVILTCASCAKRTESKLVGAWTIQQIGDNGWPEDLTWTFYSGGDLEVFSDPLVGVGNTQRGNYEVFTRSLVTPYIRIKGMGDLSLNGNWRVEKCNNKHLILNRVEWLNGDTKGAFLRREFTK